MKDLYLVIKLGRIYLGRARAIQVTMAPCPLGQELPLQSSSKTQSQPPKSMQAEKPKQSTAAAEKLKPSTAAAAERRADNCCRADSR